MSRSRALSFPSTAWRSARGGVTTAQKEIEAKYGFPVASIVSMAEVVETLYNHEIDGKVVIDDELKAAIDAYYEQYGVK